MSKSNKNKLDISIYFILRGLVILTLITQIIQNNYENAFLCILTLGLFMIPVLINHKLNIKLPSVLETIIFLFIFSAEILGEIQNFYGIFKNWDTILHTINGFLCAAIGFSLVDILNNAQAFQSKMSPLFVALVAFCFSMTIGVLWEFVEYSIDTVLLKNQPIVIDNIEKTIIQYKNSDGNKDSYIIEGGYLDIGLKDSMKDLYVNFIGALIYSTIGFLYIKNRDNYKFAKLFLLVNNSEKRIE